MTLQRPYAPAQSLVCASLLLLLSACDSGSELSESGGVATASFGGAAISLTSVNAQAVVTVSVSETLTSSTPFFDAETGQMATSMTATEPDRRYDLHSGSTPDGAFALDLTATDPATGRTDELGSVSVRDGLLVASDRAGQAIPGTQVGLHTALGTTSADPLSVMGGLVADNLPVSGAQAARGTTQAGVTSVTTSGGLTTITMQTTDSAPGASPTVQKRVYQYRDSKYVLQELNVEVTDNTSSEQVVRQTTLTFSDVTWFEGMEAAAMGGSPWGSGEPMGIPPPPCTDLESCEPPPDPGGGTNGCATPPTTPTGANIVYVHGINADGNAWGSAATNNAVRGKNRCDLVIAGDVAPSLTRGVDGDKGLGRHADQAAQLREDVIGSGLDNLIFVGHSQGGLISRRAAQSLQATPTTQAVRTLRGVVTTGTPHLGANVARNASSTGVPNRIARTFSGGFACRVSGQCALMLEAVNAFQSQFTPAVLASDAMFDLRPASSAIQQVNTRSESFRRFGIQNALTSHSFLFYQIAGDIAPGNKGRAVREVATAVSIIALSTAIISGIVSIFAPWAAISAAIAATVFAAIIGADLAWSRLTFGSQQSDGVVELPSQSYPTSSPGVHTPVNRRSLDPSSHTAQIDSERSAQDIQITLTRGLNVQER